MEETSLTKEQNSKAENCASKIGELLTGKAKTLLSLDDLETLAKEIQQHRNILQKSGIHDVNADAKVFASEKARRATLRAVDAQYVATRDQMVNLTRKAEAKRRMEASGGIVNAMRSFISGIERQFHGSNDSLDNNVRNMETHRSESFLQSLDQEQKDLGRSGSIRNEIIQEIYEESSGNSNAAKIAKTMQTFFEMGVQGKEKYIGTIDRVKHWVPRSADSVKYIRNGGVGGEQFIEGMLKHGDLQDMVHQYYPEATEAELRQHALEFLKEAWIDVTSGREVRPYERDQTYGQRIKHTREFSFKNAEGEIWYQDNFGKGDMWASAIQKIKNDARQEVVLRDWSSNPTNMLRQIQADYVNAARENPKLSSETKYIENMFSGGALNTKNRLSSEFRAAIRNEDPNIVNNLNDYRHYKVVQRTLAGLEKISPDLADLTAHANLDSTVTAVTALQSASKLGSAVHMVADYKNIFLTELSHGRGFFDTLQTLASRIGEDYGNNKELLLRTSAGIESQLGELHRYMPGGTAGGVGRVMALNQKLQGWNMMGGVLRKDVSRIHSIDLAENLSKGYDGMNPRFRNILERYAIDDPAHINALSEVAKTHQADGNHLYFTPEMAQEAKGLSQDIRDELQRKLGTYFTGEQANSIHVHTLKMQMALEHPLGMDFQKGGVAYNMNRIVQQFMSYGIYTAQHPFQRMLHNTGSPMENWGDAARILPLSVGLGYLALSLKNLATGKQPLPVEKEHLLETIMHSGAYGGFTGAYQDLLLDRMQKHAQAGILESIGGPAGGELSKILHGEMLHKDYWSLSNAERTVLDNAPFVNLHVFRMANAYLWRNRLDEMLDPGHGERMARYAEKAGTPYFTLTSPESYAGK